jgi:hypothetical protein
VIDTSPDKIRVYFENSGEKVISKAAYKLQLVDSPEHDIMAPTRNQGRINKLPEKRVSFNLMAEDFHKWFPNGGLKDNCYTDWERNYKLVAHNTMLDLLNQETFGNLLHDKEYEEICSKALRVMNMTNLLHHMETISFKNGLDSFENKKAFSEKLYDLLYDTDQFERHFTSFSNFLGCIEGTSKNTRINVDKFAC